MISFKNTRVDKNMRTAPSKAPIANVEDFKSRPPKIAIRTYARLGLYIYRWLPRPPHYPLSLPVLVEKRIRGKYEEASKLKSVNMRTASTHSF
jgi:hypothetical protein